MTTMDDKTLARFMSRIVKLDNGCWQWTGYTNGGYGGMNVNGKAYRVHRLAYEHFVGPIPEGLVLDHLCRNRACANPDHLEPVTHHTNILRGVGTGAQHARRTHCSKCGGEYTQRNDNPNWRFCKACASAYNLAWKREWRKTHREHLRAYHRERKRRLREAAQK